MDLSEMISGIRAGKESREKVIRVLYRDEQLKNGIRKTIQWGRASDSDFRDIFNYTLLQFVKNVMKNPDFEIKSNINSYLFGVARNLWMEKLRKEKIKTEALHEKFDAKDENPTIDLMIIDEEKKNLLHQVLDNLGNKCREVLMLWASNFKMKAIAEQLGYASAEVVRKKKFFCMKELSKFMVKHPHVKLQLR